MRYAVIFLLLLCFILLVRFIIFFKTIKTYQPGDKLEITHTLLSNPKVKYQSQSFFVHGVLIVLPEVPEYFYGDTVRIEGIVEEKTSTTSDKRSYYILKDPIVTPVKKPYTGFLVRVGTMRRQIENTFNSYLPPRYSNLLLGIVLGIKGNFDEHFYKALQESGVMHVIAASGMNVSMIGGFLLGILSRVSLRRAWAILLVIIILVFYAVLSGLEPSIVRATIMGCIAYSASLFGRQSLSFISLLLTGFIMLFLDPRLLFDVGFQLSFLSTLGILVLKPLFDAYFQSFKRFFVYDDFATTTTAQLATVPVMVSTFSSYSPISLLTNTLVLWTIPFLMIIGALAALLALVNPAMAAPFLYLSYPLLFFFEKVVIVLSGFVGTLEVGSIPPALVIGYYLLLAAGVALWSKRVRTKQRRKKERAS